MKPPVLDPQGVLDLQTDANRAIPQVIGSQPLTARLTDRFFAPPVDIKKKYGAMPNQFHVSYTTAGKSTAMRFLTVLRMADAGGTPAPLSMPEKGVLTLAGMTVRAELDPRQAASLSAETPTACLYINTWPKEVFGALMPQETPATLLVEKTGGAVSIKVSANMKPVH